MVSGNAVNLSRRFTCLLGVGDGSSGALPQMTWSHCETRRSSFCKAANDCSKSLPINQAACQSEVYWSRQAPAVVCVERWWKRIFMPLLRVHINPLLAGYFAVTSLKRIKFTLVSYRVTDQVSERWFIRSTFCGGSHTNPILRKGDAPTKWSHLHTAT
jgi:hypothetical protein